MAMMDDLRKGASNGDPDHCTEATPGDATSEAKAAFMKSLDGVQYCGSFNLKAAQALCRDTGPKSKLLEIYDRKRSSLVLGNVHKNLDGAQKSSNKSSTLKNSDVSSQEMAMLLNGYSDNRHFVGAKFRPRSSWHSRSNSLPSSVSDLSRKCKRPERASDSQKENGLSSSSSIAFPSRNTKSKQRPQKQSASTSHVLSGGQRVITMKVESVFTAEPSSAMAAGVSPKAKTDANVSEINADKKGHSKNVVNVIQETAPNHNQETFGSTTRATRSAKSLTLKSDLGHHEKKLRHSVSLSKLKLSGDRATTSQTDAQKKVKMMSTNETVCTESQPANEKLCCQSNLTNKTTENRLVSNLKTLETNMATMERKLTVFKGCDIRELESTNISGMTLKENRTIKTSTDSLEEPTKVHKSKHVGHGHHEGSCLKRVPSEDMLNEMFELTKYDKFINNKFVDDEQSGYSGSRSGLSDVEMRNGISHDCSGSGKKSQIGASDPYQRMVSGKVASDGTKLAKPVTKTERNFAPQTVVIPTGSDMCQSSKTKMTSKSEKSSGMLRPKNGEKSSCKTKPQMRDSTPLKSSLSLKQQSHHVRNKTRRSVTFADARHLTMTTETKTSTVPSSNEKLVSPKTSCSDGGNLSHDVSVKVGYECCDDVIALKSEDNILAGDGRFKNSVVETMEDPVQNEQDSGVIADMLIESSEGGSLNTSLEPADLTWPASPPPVTPQAPPASHSVSVGNTHSLASQMNIQDGVGSALCVRLPQAATQLDKPTAGSTTNTMPAVEVVSKLPEKTDSDKIKTIHELADDKTPIVRDQMSLMYKLEYKRDTSPQFNNSNPNTPVFRPRKTPVDLLELNHVNGASSDNCELHSLSHDSSRTSSSTPRGLQMLPHPHQPSTLSPRTRIADGGCHPNTGIMSPGELLRMAAKEIMLTPSVTYDDVWRPESSTTTSSYVSPVYTNIRERSGPDRLPHKDSRLPSSKSSAHLKLASTASLRTPPDLSCPTPDTIVRESRAAQEIIKSVTSKETNTLNDAASNGKLIQKPTASQGGSVLQYEDTFLRYTARCRAKKQEFLSAKVKTRSDLDVQTKSSPIDVMNYCIQYKHQPIRCKYSTQKLSSQPIKDRDTCHMTEACPVRKKSSSLRTDNMRKHFDKARCLFSEVISISYICLKKLNKNYILNLKHVKTGTILMDIGSLVNVC